MFTNWLTATSTANAQKHREPTNHQESIFGTDNMQLPPDTFPKYCIGDLASTAPPPTTTSGDNNNGRQTIASLPDVILEVGPSPANVRFIAHSIVLGMHSGYLRSAIRLDENIAASSGSSIGIIGGMMGARSLELLSSSSSSSTLQQQQPFQHQSSASGLKNGFILYLDNVTADQFAPLLTYMYTGYLELTVENIFGVLLATHVLHMPRALEICRSFLARLQSEGYFCGNNVTTTTTTVNTTVAIARVEAEIRANYNSRIIRPIPSKATTASIASRYCYMQPPTRLQQQDQSQRHYVVTPPPTSELFGTAQFLSRGSSETIIPQLPNNIQESMAAQAECIFDHDILQHMSRRNIRQNSHYHRHKQRFQHNHDEIDVVVDDDDDDDDNDDNNNDNDEIDNDENGIIKEINIAENNQQRLSPVTTTVSCNKNQSSNRSNITIINAVHHQQKQSSDEEIFIDTNEVDLENNDEIDWDISVTSSPDYNVNQKNSNQNNEDVEKIIPQNESNAPINRPVDNTSKDIASTSTQAIQFFNSVEIAKTPKSIEKKSKLQIMKSQTLEKKPKKSSSSMNTNTSNNRQRNRYKIRDSLQLVQPPMPISQILQTHITVTESTNNALTKYNDSASGSGSGNSSNNNAPKFIIDVASCDGPVRFRRILNTAYENNNNNHTFVSQPSTLAEDGPSVTSFQHTNDAKQHVLPAKPIIERSEQSVSLSFHQQMAKTISQQQEHNRQHGNESENSEGSQSDSICGNNNNKNGRQIHSRNNTILLPQLKNSEHQHQQQHSSKGNITTLELYVCVYCKHTFKSQYCYQKHAKRHLNPLTLNCTTTKTTTTTSSANKTCSTEQKLLIGNNSMDNSHNQDNEKLTNNSSTNILSAQKLMATTPIPSQQHHSPSSSVQPNSSSGSSSSRRDMRPLDMNVQYYPCKTCGSKFPSYYFVHKHRKMCHANVEIIAAVAAAATSASAAEDNDTATIGIESTTSSNLNETEIGIGSGTEADTTPAIIAKKRRNT